MTMRTAKALFAGFIQFLTTPALAADPLPELTPLAPFTGKTWQTVSGSADGSDGFTDVSKWEWILMSLVVYEEAPARDVVLPK